MNETSIKSNAIHNNTFVNKYVHSLVYKYNIRSTQINTSNHLNISYLMYNQDRSTLWVLGHAHFPWLLSSLVCVSWESVVPRDTPPLCSMPATGSPTAHALQDSRAFPFPRMRTSIQNEGLASFWVRSVLNRNTTRLELRITNIMNMAIRNWNIIIRNSSLLNYNIILRFIYIKMISAS